MIGDPFQREDELAGKTLLIVGLGQIGGRLAEIAKAFDMRVSSPWAPSLRRYCP
jgi:D-2-hydroxyacid dehydrogenase (NADP+)